MASEAELEALLEEYEPKGVVLDTVEYRGNDVIHDPVAVDDKDGRLSVRQKLEQFEQSFKEAIGSDRGDMDRINDEGLKEHFFDGVYVRELFIPKDHIIVSQLWKRERMWIIAYGETTFVTEMGKQRVKAPFTKIVPLGSKVALYTHEDTLWFAIAAADAMNNEDAENELIAEDYSQCIYPWDQLETKR